MHALRAVLVVCLLAGVAWLAFGAWIRSTTAEPGTDVAIIATPAPQLEAAPVEWVTVTPAIKTRGATVKRSLKLPDPVQADATQHVLDAARIAPSDHAQTVTTVLDADTGETQTYVVAEPLPWFGLRQRGDAGAYLGIKAGEPTLRLQARHEIAQVKSLRLGALASIDVPINGSRADPDAFIGVGAWVSW